MNRVHSNDGTSIVFDQYGEGPALILVTGAIATRLDASLLATKLSSNFCVYAYDRRGRGDSGDTQPYAVKREVEDIAALINAAGGSAYLYGHSSGAVLSLEAASQLKGIRSVAVYEPPLIVESSRSPVGEDLIEKLVKLLSSGRRGDMLELFMTEAVGAPAESVSLMRQQPFWPLMEKIAHTLLYDMAIVKEYEKGRPLSPELVGRLASIKVPTLVLSGGASPAWMGNGAQAAAQAIPGAQHRILEGQTHGVKDEVLIPVLVEFFKS